MKHTEVKALENVSFSVLEGEFVVIRGPSGSGKTTLLFCSGGMLNPTEGKVLVDGQDIYAMSRQMRARFRSERIGFVFQMFHLVPYLNVVDNVLLPSGMGSRRYQREDAEKILATLNLEDRMYHRPSEISAGEKQRTAMARALLKHPSIILADEPTGNLDPGNAQELIKHLDMFRQIGGTVVVVTHGDEFDRHADHIYHLDKGHISQKPHMKGEETQ